MAKITVNVSEENGESYRSQSFFFVGHTPGLISILKVGQSSQHNEMYLTEVFVRNLPRAHAHSTQ